MNRGVSSGGGQSSLGYLFGSGDAPNPARIHIDSSTHAKDNTPAENKTQIPAGIPANTTTNNYQRADGQNTGNFITDRPSTKVQAAPGGDSSLGYLFGSGGS